MMRFRNLLFFIGSLPAAVILIWFFVIPDSSVQTAVEDALVSQTDSRVVASLNNFRKGLLLTAYADSLDIKVDAVPALTVTGIRSTINPLSAIKKGLLSSVEGRLGTGDVRGHFALPGKGTLTIDRAELNSIAYLKTLGLEGEGYLSADISFEGDSLDATFHIPDADIRGSFMGAPLPVRSVRRVQGALSVRGSTVTISSVSLEADKGYARLRGTIDRGYANLSLEIMPEPGKLENYESMLLAQFQVSPGYYIIPIKGPLL